MKNLILLLLASFLLHTQTSAQKPVLVVSNQLISYGTKLQNNGFNLTHDVKFDELDDDYSQSFNLTLDKGIEYRIIATCDNDCKDIDLFLYDEGGNEISKHILTDDVPFVSVTPKWTGRFMLKVKMCECLLNPCVYGFVVFGR